MAQEFVILTQAQADAVRGVSIAGHALDPRPLKDGKFALPVEVLADPAHAKHKSLLQGLAKRNPITDVDWLETGDGGG